MMKRAAAIVANILSINPILGPDDLRDFLRSTAEKGSDYDYFDRSLLPGGWPSGWNRKVGYGTIANGIYTIAETYWDPIPLPTITSPPDIYVGSGSSGNQISWTADSSQPLFQHIYEIYINNDIRYYGAYNDGITFIYTFAAPIVTPSHQINVIYKCCVYNAFGYTEDILVVTVVGDY
ncbi:S8 family peptidase [Promethearchaeum syntrophicum]|uniref:S8 family peptidase n=1 Tax=Promethearchaeum syntrophicum TaxID=2594042 RepID=A0A5B9DBE7_9ARCH|nr:S8 family peptidase [Candidatus Prometheoarchaeum syntrophicum]QEE16341.1 hypothetical protein DSAG12_02171 [Candidatus Prometheoarchaeum syntrophicum]